MDPFRGWRQSGDTENSLAHSISKSKVIPYAPEALNSFRAYGFEWIDNLHFLADPSEFLDGDPAPYITIVKERFFKLGWQGTATFDCFGFHPSCSLRDCTCRQRA